MNNDRLYRAKRKEDKVWIIGYLSYPDAINAKIDDENVGFLGYDEFEVEVSTIGQSSGLKDKNGKEIFEGDYISVERKDDNIIVECKFGTIERQMGTGFLCDITGFYFEREDGCQTFPIKKNYKDVHDLQVFSVIGNIHDNPELRG